MKKKKKKSQEKIPKMVELASVTLSYFDSVMTENDEIGVTNLSKELELKGKRNPHVHTVKKLGHLLAAIKPIASQIEVLYDKHSDVRGFRKIPRPEISFKKETRTNQLNVMNRLDALEEERKKHTRILESIAKKLKI